MIHWPRPAAAMIPAAMLVAACAAEPAPTATVRDSAGISIVENQAPTRPVHQVVDSAPILEIGGSDAHDEFARVNGVRWLPDGGVVVADAEAQEIRIFEADGAWRATAGRKGGGPGEFEGLNGVDVLPDGSILGFDFQHRRMSHFSPNGTLTGEVALDTEGPMFPQLIGRLADGRALYRAGNVFGMSETASGVARNPAMVMLFDSTGSLLDTVGTYPGSEALVQMGGEGERRSISVMTLPMGRSTRFAPLGDRLVVAPSDDYSLNIYRLDGTLERSVRRPFTKRPITDADIERYLQDMAERGNRDFVDQMRKSVMEAPRPDAMPAYGNLLVGPGQQLWVADFVPPGVKAPTRWSVFDSTGQWLGEVEMPTRFTPHQITADRVLGIWLDPDDVPFVRAYRFR